MAHPFMTENIWLDKWRCEDAEKAFYEKKYCGEGCVSGEGESCTSSQKDCCRSAESQSQPASGIAAEIAKARAHIQNSLNSDTAPAAAAAPAAIDKLLEKRVQVLERETKDLRDVIKSLQTRLSQLETSKCVDSPVVPEKPVDKPAAQDEEEEDDFELFGSDDEAVDEEAEKLKEERLAAYAAKKSKKPALIAKSNLILDVKPWDDETDMKVLEDHVRSIELDGLLWGAAKLVPLAYGVKKLQISCVVEDDKVGTDDLEERITAFEDYVQSMDVAAFNKV